VDFSVRLTSMGRPRLVLPAAAAIIVVAAVTVWLASGPAPTSRATAVDLELARKFSPILEMAADDFDPVDVGVLLDPAACAGRLMRRVAGGQPEVLAQCAGDDALAAVSGQRGLYIDVAGLTPASTPAAPADAGAQAQTGDDYLGLQRKLVRERGFDAVTYARVQSGNGIVTVDYWFFYLFDFVQIGSSRLGLLSHEGDWERVRLTFAASGPEEALSRQPSSIGLSQHRCDGDSSLVQVPWPAEGRGRSANHPLIYVAAGSHANFVTPGPQPSSQCVIIDQTFADRKLTPEVQMLDCSAQRPAWVRFGGLWGEPPGGVNGPCFHGG
jgi:hypothetical protein